MSIVDDVKVSADIALQYYWGRVYESLKSNPQSRSWYIDDRADPHMFWRLLSVADPELYRERQSNHIPKGYLADVVRYLSKKDVRENVEHMLKFRQG